MERWKQNLINTINMLPHNEESFKFLKEMAIQGIKEKKLDKPKFELSPNQLTNIEKRFQEDMINDMDSQY